MASPGTIEPYRNRLRDVRRRVIGSSEADIIAAVRGDYCAVPRRRDAPEEKVVTMTMAKMESEMRPGPMARVRQVTDGLGLLPLSLIQLMARVGMAVIFWRSGQAKPRSRSAWPAPG